jgi:hypothetical protein
MPICVVFVVITLVEATSLINNRTVALWVPMANRPSRLDLRNEQPEQRQNRKTVDKSGTKTQERGYDPWDVLPRGKHLVSHHTFPPARCTKQPKA